MVARAEERGIAPRTLQKQLEALLEAAPYPAGDPQAEDPVWAFLELTDSMIGRAVQTTARNSGVEHVASSRG